MKKISLVIVFALVAVCVIMPKVIAPKFQEKLNSFVEYLNTQPGYNASVESIESSWFSSKNTLVIELDVSHYNPSLQGQEIEIEFEVDTLYGPLLFADQGLIGLYATDMSITGEKQRELLTWDLEQPLYKLSALSGFTGNISFSDTVPAFENTEHALTFSGYNGEGSISQDKILYESLLELVKVDHPLQPVKAENITLSIDANTGLETMMLGGFYDGSTEFSAESFTVGEDFSTSNISMIMNSMLDEETDLGTLEIGLLAEEIIAGPEKVNDLTFKSELTKLSNQFFLDFTRFNNESLEQDLDAGELMSKQLSFFEENMEEFFASQPEFNITDFSGTFPEGVFNADLSSKLANTNTPTLDDLLSPPFWLYNSLADANIEVDDALFVALAERTVAKQMGVTRDAPGVKQQAEFFIELFEGQGFFVHEDNQYRSTLKLESGETYINGKSIPLL